MTPPLAPVPTLAQVAADAHALDDQPYHVLIGLMFGVIALQQVIAAKIAVTEPTGTLVHRDRLLTIEQAAEALQVSRDTMARWLKGPYNAAVVSRSKNFVRVSADALDKVVRSRGLTARRRRAADG